MSDIDVSPGALREHATQVDTLMDQLKEAAADGDGLFDLRAFGLIGSTWSQILHLWCTDAKNHVDTSAAAGHSIAEAMREMAASYEQQDQQHSQTFRAIDAQLAGSAG